MDQKGAVEAALFSASGPLSVKEIAARIGLSESGVRTSLKALAAEYENRGSAIKIAKIGPEYVMQLRDEYTDCAGKFSEMELTKSMMKTLSTVAYNQPVLQSELCRTLGAKVYDDVKRLMDAELINGKPTGQTLELTTTKHFLEYFGVEGTGKEAVRKWIEEYEKHVGKE
jgi:segregation and condensation protein B